MSNWKKWMGNLLIICSLLVVIGLGIEMKNAKDHQNELVGVFESMKTETLKEAAPDNEKSKVEAVSAPNLTEEMEGILKIPSIELKAPVMAGAAPEVLDQALGSISGLDAPGEIGGSYAIAGHQAHVYGKFFNRLNEVKKGDRLQFETMAETLDFEVFDIQIVRPEDVEVLREKEGIALLSLITCYPENSNKFRLVVQAKRI